jgi:hypothetical protein
LHLAILATNAIDKVPTLATVTNDFDGELRPKGAASDIGADEFTTNVPPVMKGVGLIGTNTVVSFATVLGMSYDLMSASNLPASAWSTTATNVPGTGAIVQVTDTNGALDARRFYRARLSP